MKVDVSKCQACHVKRRCMSPRATVTRVIVLKMVCDKVVCDKVVCERWCVKEGA